MPRPRRSGNRELNGPRADRDRHLLIVEMGHTGHLLVFVRHLATYALAHGWTVSIGIPESTARSEEFSQTLEGMADLVRIVDIPADLSPRTLRKLAQSLCATDVLVPHGDVFATRSWCAKFERERTYTFLVMRDPRWEGFSLTSPARTIKNLAKLGLLKATTRRRGARIVWLREPGYTSSSREEAVIDPFIYDEPFSSLRSRSIAIRGELGLDADHFWFGITGAITDRKNLPLIVAALGKAKAATGREIGLAVFGPVRSESGFGTRQIRAKCKEAGIRVAVHDDLISNDDMNAAILAFDVTVMAYSTHSPNSTLGKAFVLGQQLVVAGPTSVQRFARGLGFDLVSSLDVDSVASSMERALDAGSNQRNTHLQAASLDAFCQGLIEGSQAVDSHG